jgi:hypothetical protein
MIAIIIVSILMVALIVYFVWLIKSGHLKKCSLKSDVTKATNIFNNAIKEAFNVRNNIDHCPKCGSHNIKLYRKGYNYKVGFWGAIFGVRGAGYAGGFKANNTCCRCMNCGNDWETDYDYRLIDK